MSTRTASAIDDAITSFGANRSSAQRRISCGGAESRSAAAWRATAARYGRAGIEMSSGNRRTTTERVAGWRGEASAATDRARDELQVYMQPGDEGGRGHGGSIAAGGASAAGHPTSWTHGTAYADARVTLRA